MNTVKLNGASAEKIAKLIGGVLIMVNLTDDTATISGGDITLLEVSKEEKNNRETYPDVYDQEVLAVGNEI